ncbi:hypothetical protein Golax_025640, partial [Gossypium laxum]|nr:hypothetical protein [Gossypium laxum]
EGDDEGLESDGEGDLEKVESSREGDVGEVQADGEGVSTISIEVDEDIGMKSDGHISLGSTVGEANYSEVATDEYAGSNEHGSLVGSDEDEKHEDGKRKRSKFLLYNDKLKLSLGMLIKDGKQFKSAI